MKKSKPVNCCCITVHVTKLRQRIYWQDLDNTMKSVISGLAAVAIVEAAVILTLILTVM